MIYDKYKDNDVKLLYLLPYGSRLYHTHNENSDFDNKEGVEKEKKERPRITFRRS